MTNEAIIRTQLADREQDVIVLRKALAGIKAALGQNKTFPADIEYARQIAAHALECA